MHNETQPLPPLASVISFIDCINRRDLEGLLELMTEDHALMVLDEKPVTGREQMRDAWRGYFDAFPAYVIYPCKLAQTANVVAVLGYTTGSHLALPDEEESRLGVIWTAEVANGRLRTWSILDDEKATRERLGLEG